MIIRMTLGDNDFGERLASFAENLMSRLLDVWKDAVRIGNKDKEKFFDLLSPEAYPRLDKDQKKLVCEAVRDAWETFVYKYAPCGGKNDRLRHYLLTNFQVSITYTLHEKWENGEVVYYFTWAQKYIIQ